MYLIGFFVHWFDFELTKHFNRQLILNKSLIKNGIIFKLTRSDEPHHQDKIVGDVRITENIDNIVNTFNFIVVQSRQKHLLDILKNHALEMRFNEKLF